MMDQVLQPPPLSFLIMPNSPSSYIKLYSYLYLVFCLILDDCSKRLRHLQDQLLHLVYDEIMWVAQRIKMNFFLFIGSKKHESKKNDADISVYG